MIPTAAPATLTLASYLHDIDPIAFVVPGLNFPIRWYGLSYIAGFVAGYFILKRLARVGLFRVPHPAVLDVLLALIAGTMIGGRLGYVLIYNPSLLVDFTGDFPFWGVLRLTNGGMASHGGMVGVAVACWLVARHFKAPPLHIFDAVALVAPIGIFLGRLANFVNAELLGKVVAPAGVPAPGWAVRYPQELLERRSEAWAALSPDQQLGLARAMEAYLPPDFPPADAEVVAATGVPYAIASLHAGSDAARAALEPYVAARHPTQLYQALAEGVLTLVVCWVVFRARRRPGTVTAWFLITYGVGRIATEFVRLPDSHLATARILGLSRGQWLSAGMILIGVALLVLIARRGSEKLPGWATPRAERPAVEDVSKSAPADA